MDGANGIEGVWELIGHSEGVEALLYFSEPAKEYVLDEYVVEEVDGYNIARGDLEQVPLGPVLADALAAVAGRGYVGVRSETQSSKVICALLAEPFGSVLNDYHCFHVNGLNAEVRGGLLALEE